MEGRNLIRQYAGKKTDRVANRRSNHHRHGADMVIVTSTDPGAVGTNLRETDT